MWFAADWEAAVMAFSFLRLEVWMAGTIRPSAGGRPACSDARPLPGRLESRRREARRGVVQVAPPLQAAEQRPHPGDAVTLQEERRPGARRLVGSGAVQHDLP